MIPDGVFLAARDLLHHVPLASRIVEVVEYPIGTRIGGRPSRQPFNALMLEMKNAKGDWRKAKKPLRLNNTQQVRLYTRFGEMVEWWEGQEITLDLAPTRSPDGGRTSGTKLVYGIIVAPLTDELDEEKLADKMRRAVRGECPYHEQETANAGTPEREPGDDDPDEPPADWPGHGNNES